MSKYKYTREEAEEILRREYERNNDPREILAQREANTRFFRRWFGGGTCIAIFGTFLFWLYAQYLLGNLP